MIKVERALQDILDQIDYFHSDECKNDRLSVKTESADALASSGWIKSRVAIMVNENKFTVNQLQDYFNKYCRQTNILDLGLLQFTFPDDDLPVLAQDFLDTIMIQIVDSVLNKKIYEHLKQIKNESSTKGEA